jgi:hypothetical protein
MLRRISVDDFCKDMTDCPSVWVDDDNPDELLIVGYEADPGVVPLAKGEVAIRIRRQVVVDARIS